MKQRSNDTKPLPSKFPPARRYKKALMGTPPTPGQFGDNMDLEHIFNMYDGCLPTSIESALQRFLEESESLGMPMKQQWDQEKDEAESSLYRRTSACRSPSLVPSELLSKMSLEPTTVKEKYQGITQVSHMASLMYDKIL